MSIKTPRRGQVLLYNWLLIKYYIKKLHTVYLNLYKTKLSLVQIWRKRKKERKDSDKLAIRPDYQRRRIEVKVCMLGGLWCVVL